MSLLPDELSEVLPLCFPLPREAREPFLAAIENALRAHPVHGPGLVHRLARDLQPSFFTPPPKSPAPQFFNARKHPR
jgi:hypothetical protein